MPACREHWLCACLMLLHLMSASCSAAALDASESSGSQTGAPRAVAAVAGTDCEESAGSLSLGATLYLGSSSAAPSDYSYAIYRLPLGGATPERLYIDVFFDIVPADPADNIWVGMGDYLTGAWEWRGPLTGSPCVVELGSSRYVSPMDELAVAIVVCGGSSCHVAGVAINPPILEVGAGQDYARIEDAYAAAGDGAVILVHPLPGGAAYDQPAQQVYKPGIAFRGVIEHGARVKLDGAGYNYTGAGSTPRAVFQFNPGADGGSVAGFEILDAHNDTFNGAAVRINQANNVTVRDCEIHDCDMGIMSNGAVADNSAFNQVIEFSVIHHNGNAGNPGYNHNLYLAGTSVTLRGCEVFASLTGHNVKSRAHFNRVEYCYIHDSANREFDLVDDAGNTTVPGSDSVLLGNIIVKDPACTGNRAVIHFGQDGGNSHLGTLWLVHNTIVTPFISPVVDLSAVGAGAALFNNIVWDDASGQGGQVLVAVKGGAILGDVAGGHNWLSAGQTITAGTLIDDGSNYHAGAGENPPFVDAINADHHARDYRLTSADPHLAGLATPWNTLGIPTGPGQAVLLGLREYQAPNGLTIRDGSTAPEPGAYEYSP